MVLIVSAYHITARAIPKWTDPYKNYLSISIDNQHFLVDALLSLNDLEDLLGTRLNDRAAHYDTLCGLIMYKLGELPEERETLIINNHRFPCIKVEGNAIHKVKIEPVSHP